MYTTRKEVHQHIQLMHEMSDRRRSVLIRLNIDPSDERAITAKLREHPELHPIFYNTTRADLSCSLAGTSAVASTSTVDKPSARKVKVRNGNNQNPKPRKFSRKEAAGKPTNHRNLSFHCLWPGCLHSSSELWNMKSHIREMHLNLPKTIKQCKLVVANPPDTTKWIHQHKHSGR